MLWINTKRILKAGFVNFWRNGFVSFASVVVMVITLFVIGFVVFVGAILGSSLEQLQDKVDVNVYFLTDAPEEEIIALKGDLETLPEVARVEYVSREQALENFRARHENDELTLQALDELSENPLGATLNIKAKETSQYESIARFLESDNALGLQDQPIIDRVNYFQNKAAIDRLSKIIDAAGTLGLVISLVFAVVSIIIVFSTIRLAIYTAKEEIGVMRLVGASNTYIRGPFVVEGIMYGVIAGVITLIIFYPLTLWLGPVTAGFFGSINLFDYYLANFGQFFLVIVVAGAALGALSSYLAVRRYLRI
ncbi:ABC transporter permease [Candidatus Wolfebacteria bacterium]|nr:ABC transporter permease [Candidatus Wolfebacteria bacterium]